MSEQHPVDIRDAAEIAQAVYFVSTLFVGVGRFEKAIHETLAEARVTAKAMESHYKNGRKAMVYGILANGKSVLVPDNFTPQMMEPAMTTNTETTKTFGKRFNAQRAAKSALGPDAAEGVQFTTAKNDAGEWTWTAIVAQPSPAPAEPELVIPSFMAARVLPEPVMAPVDTAALAAALPPPVVSTPAEIKQRRAERKAKPAKVAADPTAIPAPPDFSAATHARYRTKLAAIVALVEARDVAALQALVIPTYSSSPKAMAKYRDRAVAALQAA